MNQEHEIVLYQVEDTNIYVNVMFKEDTFWMTQKAMADLFECTTDNISLHLKNIYKEEELDENRRGCEITLSTEKEDFSFKMNERSSFMLKLTCDENFNYKL